MKKISSLVFSLAMATMFLQSCAGVGTIAGYGSLYTNAVEPGTATSNTVGTKVGTAQATNILGLLVTGDASIQTAARNAGIKKISHIDVKKSSILGLFATSTVYVYGE